MITKGQTMVAARVRSLILMLIVALVTGCAAKAPFVERPESLPSAPEFTDKGSGATVTGGRGSLWPGAGTSNNFFVDNKARNVNDIVTIEIVETSTASKEATTTLGRSSSVFAGIPNLLGLENKLNARLARLQSDNDEKVALDLSNMLSASTQNDFDGSGVTTRTGELSANMTALVTGVMANGNLQIQGRRIVTVNGEEQIMMLTGIIRPEDISAQNVVLSTYIADARISYYGMGVVADKQYPGWLARTFDHVWPF